MTNGSKVRSQWRAEWTKELAAARHSEGWEYFLCRWLRAREFDVDLAFAMLADHVQWRVLEGVSALSLQTEDEILG